MMTNQIEGYRLSPQQKRLWTLQERVYSHPYRVQMQISIAGDLDIETFKKAIEKVIDRHEILRTNFQCLSGMTVPLQVINIERDYYFAELDLNSVEIEIDKIWNNIKEKQFNFEKTSLLSVTLVKRSSERHTLLLALPALCGDSETLALLAKEIIAVYGAILKGEELEEEEVLQYADLAEWLTELLEDEETAEGRNYWLKQDFSNLERLRLPYERDSEEGSFKPEIARLILEPELVNKISN